MINGNGGKGAGKGGRRIAAKVVAAKAGSVEKMGAILLKVLCSMCLMCFYCVSILITLVALVFNRL